MRAISFTASTPQESQIKLQQASDLLKVRGTPQRPQPPRDIVVQSGPRGLFVTWKTQDKQFADIVGWRVYKDDETTLFHEIKDRGTRQIFIETTAGATPPSVNVFISAVNARGVESPKIQAQGAALAEAGAPAMPGPPPGYTAESSGGVPSSPVRSGGRYALE